MGLFTWLRTAYSEPSGSGSSTRIHIGMILAFILGIGISFGHATLQKQYTINEFEILLSTLGSFFVTTAGPVYGLNRLADWAKNRDNNKLGDNNNNVGN